MTTSTVANSTLDNLGAAAELPIVGSIKPVEIYEEDALLTSDDEDEVNDECESADKYENINNNNLALMYPICIGDSIETRTGEQYQIVHRLGYGGFSTVWMARDIIHDKTVALKGHDCRRLR